MSIDGLVTPERVLPIGILSYNTYNIPMYVDCDTTEVYRAFGFGGILPVDIRCIAPEMYKPTSNEYEVLDPKENMSPIRCPR